MGMNKNDKALTEDKLKARADYDDKYYDLFVTIGNMPRTNGNPEDWEENKRRKEARISYCHNLPNWDEIVYDTLKVFDVNWEDDSEDVSDKSIAVLEALNECIGYFQGMKEGCKDTFRIHVGHIYDEHKKEYQLANDEKNNPDHNYDRFELVGNHRKRVVFAKLLDNIFKFIADYNLNIDDVKSLSLDEFKRVARAIFADNPELEGQIANGDLEALYLNVLPGMSLMSAPIGEDDDATVGSLYEDKSAVRPFENAINMDIIERIIESIYEKLSTVSYLKVDEWDIFQIFFTMDLMRELKLDSNDHRYNSEPAGNYEFYKVLEQFADKLMGDNYEWKKGRKMFHKDMLDYIFTLEPKVLEETYRWVMRDGVELLDKDLMDVMHYNSAGNISKKRQRYREIMKRLVG